MAAGGGGGVEGREGMRFATGCDQDEEDEAAMEPREEQ